MPVKRKKYARGAALMLLVAALPGCLPLGAPTIIGLGLDGISYLASGKSVSDHALSQLAQKDCSIGRAVLTGTDLCKTPEDAAPVLVARNEDVAPVVAVQNIELASAAPSTEMAAENPLFTTLHPSRWPAIPEPLN